MPDALEKGADLRVILTNRRREEEMATPLRTLEKSGALAAAADYKQKCR